MLQIFIIFSENLASLITLNYDGTAASDAAIWEELSPKYQKNAQLAHFGCK